MDSLGTFSCISIVDLDEFYERYRIANVFGDRFKKAFLPYLPGYISASIQNIGLASYDIRGYSIYLPPLTDEKLLQKRLKRAVKSAARYGNDVLVVNPVIKSQIKHEKKHIKISDGTLYPPMVLIDAAKTVASLMGMDFKRSNICIADASSPMGVIITELLLSEASYLTLCTNKKEKINRNIDNFILRDGLSPAVVSDYKKAMSTCDVLFYTGDVDLSSITSFVSKGILIINVLGEKVKAAKDFLIIDEVLLHGQKEPTTSDVIGNQDRFLTSRMWEGALLTLLDFDTSLPSIKKAYEIGNLAKRLGLRTKAIMKSNQILKRDTIYNYK